jgi:iron complex outermembrane receptor protein
MLSRAFARTYLSLMLGTSALCSPALAQEEQADSSTRTGNSSATDALMEDIVVTGTKQSRAQEIQKVPLTISAYSSEQIDALKIPDLISLGTSVPGAQFEQTTVKGTANFSIRGLGINSSKVSSAPAVGIFLNGVYMGVNQGVLFDTFDLEGVEVLRGPQGTLFGRNVTGGAVLLRYKRPDSDPDFQFRARAETGPSYSVAAAGGGALSDEVSARLAVIYENDAGYFENTLLNDKNFPKSEMITVRPSLRFQNDRTDITLFGEYGRITGDGTANYAPDYVVNAALYPNIPKQDRYEYNDILAQFPGETFVKWYGSTLDARQEVDFGDDAALTFIAGYRNLLSYTFADIDGTPQAIAHTRILVDQDQYSAELRYNGTFGPATLTLGSYHFHQNALQMNGNPINGALSGAQIIEDVFGFFGQVDLKVADGLLVQVGGRYNLEDKDANVSATASQTPGVILPGANGVPGSCRLTDRRDPYGCNWTFRQNATFSNFNPKFTLQYQFAPTAQVYATWQRAYRSGGFNSQYNAEFAQTPFSPEKQRAMEIGFKTDLFDRRTRLNGAIYKTKISDLQRDIIVFDSATLLSRSQTINTADATIKGFEAELIQKLADGLVLSGSVSHTSTKFTSIRFDLTQDPASAGGPQVTAFDYQQRMPRVMPWTYSLALTADHDFGFGNATARVSWNHRDKSYFADYNFNRRDGADVALPASDIVDAQITFEPAGSAFSFSIYGRNLLNEYTLGNFTPLSYPAVKGCACYPNKGRIFGAEVTGKFR